MSFENGLQNITLIAAADFSTKQYLAVVTDGTGKAAISGVGASNTPTGILQNNPISGKAATVGVSGISKAVAAGVIAPGAKVASDATGKMVTATTGDFVMGIAQNTSNTAANDIFSVLIEKQKI